MVSKVARRRRRLKDKLETAISKIAAKEVNTHTHTPPTHTCLQSLHRHTTLYTHVHSPTHRHIYTLRVCMYYTTDTQKHREKERSFMYVRLKP